MIGPWQNRIDAERRLLAALFLWWRPVELEPRHFIAPEHGAIFDVLEQAAELWPPFPLPPESRAYDDCLLVVVLGIARDHAAAGPMGDRLGNARGWAEWLEGYVRDVLMRERVTLQALDELVETVRSCPRCGR